MTIDPSINDLLEGGGPGLKFPTIGTTHRGTILSATKTQQRTMDGKPKFWDDGNPAMQIVVTLQTTYRNDPSDDGIRRLFVAGGKLTAIRAALAGKTLEVGGELGIQYTSDGKADAGKNPPKLYQAAYRPPSPMAAANDLLGASDSATTTTNVSSATWAADGGTPEPGPAESFDPFAEEPF